MNDVIRERLLRKLETLPDEKAYMVLDYIEFLESKYGTRSAGAPAFQKVADSLEDTMRAGRVPLNVIRGTMDVVSKAGRFMEGLAAAGRAAVEEVQRKGEASAPRPAEGGTDGAAGAAGTPPVEERDPPA